MSSFFGSETEINISLWTARLSLSVTMIRIRYKADQFSPYPSLLIKMGGRTIYVCIYIKMCIIYSVKEFACISRKWERN